MPKAHLLGATALGLVLTAASAHADTTVSTDTTAPVVTSTTGTLSVTTDGSITLSSGTAITIDSDTAVDFEGEIDMSESESGSTGILITDVPNRTQALTLSGTITVNDDYDAEDTNDDDIEDAPWAEGTGRYGIRSTGASPFKGDVSIDSTLNVEGNQSYGIRFENLIDGDFTYDGSADIKGDDAVGIALDKGVTGDVYLSGGVGVLGENGRAVTIGGDVGGSLTVDGSYYNTGYSTNYNLGEDLEEDLVPSLNLLQSGPLVSISGNVAKGVLFGSSVSSTDDDNDDEDGDGRDDSDQSTASLATYGSAPALLVGSDSQAITLGGLTYASTAIDPPEVNYGLLNRGSISAAGIHSGFDATAIQLGGTGHAVTIDNGVGIAGSVSASAYGGNSTALSFQSGANTPRLDVTGSITASTATATTSVTENDVTTYTTVGGGTTARAVDIAAGASLPVLKVGLGGSISASTTGSTANANAIRDQSNTLTSIVNSGSISAGITATDDDGDDETEEITGKAIAIDTRSNTAGLTLSQVDTEADDDDYSPPSIYGQILLGSGNDSISSSGGYIYSTIDYGAGTGSFKLSDSAYYAGKMLSSGDVAIDVTDATAYLLAGSAVKASTLHIGADGIFGLTLDPDDPSTPIITASGAAVFDDGAEFDLALNRIVTEPVTFKVLTASSISLGDITSSTRDGYIPYIYHADLTTNDAGTELYAGFRLKTQAEAGYSDNQYTALLPVLAVAAQDDGAMASVLGTTEKSTFDAVYNQYLPDYSGEALMTLAQGSQSLNRGLGNLTVVPDNNGGQYWLQEYGFTTDRESGATAGFSSHGFSFAGGRESEVYGNQTIGVYLAMTATSPQDSYAIDSESSSLADYTLGGYWRLNSGAFKAWAHGGAGFVSLKASRVLITPNVYHASQARWSGYSLSGGAGASVDYSLGRMTLIPEVLADYYRLSEQAHEESGGGDFFDLSIDKRAGQLVSSSAILRARYDGSFIRPELWAGYKANLVADLPDTVARFASGDAFTLTAGSIKGGGPVAGFRLSLDNAYSYLSLEGEYEKIGEYTATSLSLRTRFQF